MAKKTTENQLVELNAKNLPKEIVDPDSGKKIKVTQDMIGMLMGAEQQITGGQFQVATGLYIVKINKLWLLYGLDSMEEYLEQRFQFGRALAYRLMKFAEVFGDSKHFAEIMQQPRKLLELAANDDDLKRQLKEGEVTLPDGTQVSLKELKKSMALELTNELEMAKKDLKATKRQAREFAQQVEEKDKRIANYEAGMAEGDFKKLTEKKQILSELFAMDAEVASIIKRLDAIESDDPQVVSRLEAVLTQLLAGASKVQDRWMHLILSVTPDQK